ncbi:MAG: glycoside hydrolase family 2 protein [Hyphomicrobiales bacterium]
MRKTVQILFIFISLCFIVACSNEASKNEVKDLCEEDWTFIKGNKTYKAEVPGNIFSDLYLNEIIDNPFDQDNEKKLEWVNQSDWIYSTTFTCDDKFLAKDAIELCFYGLDTYSKVYLNDQYILTTDNMFRKYIIDVKKHITNNNTLKIVFSSAERITDSIAKTESIQLPDKRAYLRKAPFQFGWDWGPKFITCGIYRPVSLKAYNKVSLKDAIMIPDYDIEKNLAKLDGKIRVNIKNKTDLRLKVKSDSKTYYNRKIKADQLKDTINFQFVINEPKVWWPTGMGEPNLYNFRLELWDGNTKVEEKNIQTGIRKIELIQEADKKGKSFYFKINGRPFFAKGVNYIPQDIFLTDVSDKQYQELLNTVIESNINMLRVWGGGVYEKDIFYNLCDKHGIMIWQDFMFACNMYPGSERFLDSVEEEIQDNIYRIGSHPSIILWCGNNECREGWENWGWQKSLNYSYSDSTKVWKDYKELFINRIPSTLKKLDPSRPYWESSPSIGWGHPESLLSGDAHYWGVWWGAEPFEVYNNKVGRFMTEYGTQSYPSMKTIQTFTPDSMIYIDSPILAQHQKHPRGKELNELYMKRYFSVPKDIFNYIYSSQCTQAYGINTALSAHRRSAPYCMGSFYWQLNDCWPVISWSSIDYFGRWKPLQYVVKEIYKPLTIALEKGEDHIKFYGISDSLKEKEVQYSIELKKMDGTIIKEYRGDITLIPNSSTLLLNKKNANFLDGYSINDIYVVSRLYAHKEKIFEKIFILNKPNKLNIKNPNLSVNVIPSPEGAVIYLNTKTFTPFVWMENYNSIEGKFEENFFHLEAGKEKKIIWRSQDYPSDLKQTLKVFSLYDIVKN